MEKEFNQKEYIKEYQKENYKQFKTKLKPNEMEKINDFLKENNMNKREFVKNAYKTLMLEKEIKNIVSKFQIGYEMPSSLKLSNGKKMSLNNGIIVYSYTFPVLNNEKMLILRVEFNDEIIYYGTVVYRYKNLIIDEIEELDTSL